MKLPFYEYQYLNNATQDKTRQHYTTKNGQKAVL